MMKCLTPAFVSYLLRDCPRGNVILSINHLEIESLTPSIVGLKIGHWDTYRHIDGGDACLYNKDGFEACLVGDEADS